MERREDYYDSQHRYRMEWTQARGWGMFVVVFGLIALGSILTAESALLMVILAILGLSLIYYGVQMVRSGS